MITPTTANTLALLRATRNNILGIYAAHDIAKLNKIPPPLNNNLAWNAGHVIATLELLVYSLAGLKTPSGREFIDRYRKGSHPAGDISAADHAHITQQLLGGIDQLEKDLQTLDFSNYKEYTTSYGVTLSSVDDALTFNNMHEAMHLGTILALRKLV